MGQPMNTALVDYGIREERSDIRAHVCIEAKTVYVYPTRAGIVAIETGKYRAAPAYTGTIKTAMGYLVPPAEINFCRAVPIPSRVLEKASFSPSDDTTAKGEKAVRVVCWLLRAGLFPLWVTPAFVEEAEMQIEGMDILVRMNTRIQVKCDWRGGVGLRCTGNLFLQTQECNPFGRH